MTDNVEYLQERVNDLEAEVEKQRKINHKIIEAKAALLCADHRGKQMGKPCLACTIEAQQEALRQVVDHVTSIRNCAHGIMPIYSELKTDLMKTIIGLNDARWTRLYAILAEAEEALAFAKGVMGG